MHAYIHTYIHTYQCYINGTSYGFGTTEIGLAAVKRGANIGGASAADAEAEKNADPNVAQHFRNPKIEFGDVRLLQRYKVRVCVCVSVYE